MFPLLIAPSVCVAVSQYRGSDEEVSGVLLPQLTAASLTLPALFTRVDRLLEYVEHVEHCCLALEQRVAQAEAAYTPQKTTAVSKIFSSFRVSPLTPSHSAGRRAPSTSFSRLFCVSAVVVPVCVYSGRRGVWRLRRVRRVEAVVVSTEPIGVVSAEDFFHVEAEQLPPAR